MSCPCERCLLRVGSKHPADSWSGTWAPNRQLSYIGSSWIRTSHYMQDSSRISGIIQSDPTASLRAGEVLECSVSALLVQLDGAKSEGHFPLTDLFQGLLLAMIFRDEEGDHATGSAVLVAPGLAICANHVLVDFEERLRAGHGALLCGAPARHGLVLWIAKTVTQVPNTDLALLCMTLACEMPPQSEFVVSYPSTRLPMVGERVDLYGLPSLKRTSAQPDGSATFPIQGRYTSGQILEVHPDGRDRVMMPGPCFSVKCAAYGGMSGGPVFDSRGYLVGVVSTSYNGEDPIAYVSLIWPALVAHAEPAWPAPKPLPSGPLLGIQRIGLAWIERPEAFILATSGDTPTLIYEPWS